MIDQNNTTGLLKKDQLIRERRHGNAFGGYQEGKIEFMPTYKYVPKTNDYDRRKDKKARFPAWYVHVFSGRVGGG